MISTLLGKVTHLVEDNSTTILTGIGVAGTITTGVLAGRAGYKAYEILQEDLQDRVDNETERLATTFEKLQMAGPQFIPAIGVGALTVGAILYCHKLNAKETAALVAAYSLSDKTLQEYKEKVQEKLGVKKETELRDEIAQARIDRNPPSDRSIIITGSGEVLCYDVSTDRYFQSTAENIQKAENAVNLDIANHDAVPLSRFYDELGLKPTPYTESVGWNIDNRCEVQITAAVSPDNRPCLSIDFARYPKPDFDNVYP
jgi:hypothetical protein